MDGKARFAFNDTGWAVIRTPALAVQDFESLATETAGWNATFDALKGAFDASPLIQEALNLASGGLYRRLLDWSPPQDEATTRKMVMSLWKYLNRMSYRSTPFGLFASARGVDAGPRTSIPPAARTMAADKQISLDSEVCGHLLEQLSAGLAQLPHVANESVYEIGGELRYFETRREEAGQSFHLVGVDATDALRALLACSAVPQTPAKVCDQLCTLYPDADPSAIATFVQRAREGQLLLPCTRVPISGGDSMALLRGVPCNADQLSLIDSIQAAIEDAGASVGLPAIAAVERIRDGLVDAGFEIKARNLVQVDVNGWSDEGSVCATTLADVATKVSHLFPYFAVPSTRSMDEFAARFERRYGERSIPLLEALDEEGGIGFLGARPVPSPLVQAIGVAPPQVQAAPLQQRPIDALIESRLSQALAHGSTEIVLTDADLAQVNLARVVVPPRTSCIFGSLLAPTADGRGHQFWLKSLVGSTAASLLGRFAFENQELAMRLRALASIDAADSDAIHAEILHLSHDRVGNVARRPVLREYEITCLAAAGVEHSRQIPVNDLYLSCIGSRLVLHSKHLGKRVVPHLSCMHNFGIPSSLPAYRFLCEYARSASDGVNFQAVRQPQWQRHLPRLRYANIVLSPASWTLFKEDLAESIGDHPHARIRNLARRLGAPRHVSCGRGDNTIALDLEDVLSLQFLADEIQAHGKAALSERLEVALGMAEPDAGRHYCNEIVIPVVARRADGALVPNRLAGDGAADCPVLAGERHRPGGKWCYVKVYGGKLTCERVAREALMPVVRQLEEAGELTRWHFIRYRDPDDHLRVRFLTHNGGLRAYEALSDAVDRIGLLAAGVELRLEEYKPETRRYGGPHLCGLAERLFQHDSEMVVAALAQLPEANSEARWQFALLSIDGYLGDFGFSSEHRLQFAQWMDAAYQAEFAVGRAQLNEFDRKYRSCSAAVRAALGSQGDPGLDWARALVRRRSERSADVVGSIREACSVSGRPLQDLIASYCHMSADRIFLSNLREHELLLYNFLHRHYRSALARGERAA